MQKVVLFSLLAAFAIAAPIAIAPRGGHVITDEFIVTLEENSNSSLEQLSNEIERIVSATNGLVLHKYEHTVQGFAIRTSEAGVSMLRALNGVRIEANLAVHSLAACESQSGATWGIVRVSEHALKLDGQYAYGAEAGDNVDAYIVDTGIFTEHEDFEGRASWGTDTVDNPSPKTDGNGHGTHVAGTVMSKTYGLAKKAHAIAVKVLGASGSGTNAGVIAGVDWVASHHKGKKTGRSSVANMSLGGGYSSALNQAVDAAVEAGVAFAVAAGNENQDACNVSPASASKPVTVGATTNKDGRSYFSNYGKCVHVFAPGSDITSTWIGGKSATKTISGTSMASPHVCVVLARYRAAHPTATAHEAQEFVIKSATPDTITDVKGSPNKLLYAACEY